MGPVGPQPSPVDPSPTSDLYRDNVHLVASCPYPHTVPGETVPPAPPRLLAPLRGSHSPCASRLQQPPPHSWRS